MRTRLSLIAFGLIVVAFASAPVASSALAKSSGHESHSHRRSRLTMRPSRTTAQPTAGRSLPSKAARCRRPRHRAYGTGRTQRPIPKATGASAVSRPTAAVVGHVRQTRGVGFGRRLFCSGNGLGASLSCLLLSTVARRSASLSLDISSGSWLSDRGPFAIRFAILGTERCDPRPWCAGLRRWITEEAWQRCGLFLLWRHGTAPCLRRCTARLEARRTEG